MRRHFSVGAIALISAAGLVLLFLLAPTVVLLIASLGSASYMAFPPPGWSLRWYGQFLRMPVFTGALRNSVLVGCVASVISLSIATASGYGLARMPGKFREGLQAALTAPLFIPTVVLGLGLLLFFRALVPSTSLGTLVLGHIILTFPYALRTILSSFSQFDWSLEEAGITLGATRVQTFLRVVLPLVSPGLVAAGIFSFVTSFGNLAVSMFLTSPQVSLLPIRMFAYAEFSPDPTLAAISTLVTLGTIMLTMCVELLVGLDKIM